MSCSNEHIQHLLPGYTLGACSENEAIEVQRHLSNCKQCSQQMRTWSPVREKMLCSGPLPASESVPDTLKASVMSVVQADARLFAAARERPAAAEAPVKQPKPKTLLSRLLFAPKVSVAFLSVLAVFAFVGIYTAQDKAPENIVFTASVDSSIENGKASLHLHQQTAQLKVSGLPSAGKGRVYQVWLQQGMTKPVPTKALFSVQGGSGQVSLPKQSIQGKTLLLTSEPKGGSKAPTRSPILQINTA